LGRSDQGKTREVRRVRRKRCTRAVYARFLDGRTVPRSTPPMSNSPAPVTASNGNAVAVWGAGGPRDSSAVWRRAMGITSPATESVLRGGRGRGAAESGRMGRRATESHAGVGLVGAGGSPAARPTHVFMLARY